MTRVEIDTVPGVSVLARSLLEEESACEALLECAGRFSPRVQPITNPTSFVCVVDITGTEALFGQPARLARNLLEEVRKLGLAASAAVSANFHAAAALAQSMPVVNHALVVPLGRESHALAALPVAMISLTAEQAETLTQWGITTLGQLAQLPEAALISRMGQQGKRLRLLARGEHPHHFEPIEPAFTLRERLEFESPIDILDSLLFVVSTMLEQLALRAGARALALASITVKLSLEGNATHVRTVRPALPSNDRQLWIKLIHLDLEAHPPDAAILALELHAAPGAAGKVQMGLFSPQTPEAARLDVTLARIRAIVGDHAVGSAVLEDTHRPDTFRLQAFTVPSGRPSPAVSLPGKSVSTRAVLRQLRPAENITVNLRDGQPETFYFRGLRFLVDRAYGPWLMSGAWWSGQRWRQEQWDLVARSAETLLCCVVARPSRSNQWTMAALYD
jgi:protein ImuB